MLTAIHRVVTDPSAEALWSLRADLLQAGVPAPAPVWPVLEAFHGFLEQVATSMSSRDLSQLASKMDISAISGVLVERMLSTEDSRELAQSLLAGMLSEGLMALATRQHVRAWEGELDAHYRHAAWFLYGALWQWTAELRPEIGAEERRRLLDRLLAPARDPGTRGLVKAALVGRLFQVLLLARLAESVAAKA
jgi:hypothetical protein